MVQLAEHVRTQIVEALRHAGKPQRIILLGSRSRGDARPDSDIDLMVIEPRDDWQKQVRHEEIGRLRRALPRLNLPVDLLLITPSEVETWRHARNHIVAHALREGEVLYG